MAYLVVKAGNQTKSYSVKASANKPYLRVSTGYIPLTTETTTATGLRAKVGGSVCRPIETYTTTVQTTVTTGTSYGTRSSTYSTTYGTRKSTSQTGYETRQSQYQTYSISTYLTSRNSWNTWNLSEGYFEYVMSATGAQYKYLTAHATGETGYYFNEAVKVILGTNRSTVRSMALYNYITEIYDTTYLNNQYFDYAIAFPSNYFSYIDTTGGNQSRSIFFTDAFNCIKSANPAQSNYGDILASYGLVLTHTGMSSMSNSKQRTTLTLNAYYVYANDVTVGIYETLSNTVYYNTTRKSTSATTYGTRSSTSQTGYLTRSSTSATVYLTTTESRETTSQ